MLTYGLPILYALAIWWGSTMLILVLNGRDRTTYPWSLLGATVLTVAAFGGIVATRGDRTTVGAYHAFTCGVVAWAWQILTFYMGYITGPSKQPCAPHWRGWQRFVAALRVCLYHELATLVMAGGIAMLLWHAANPVALWTYVVLWWMHTSAKLNVFFGVRNLGEDLIPHHLRYILSYMPRRRMNAFFPFSVLISTIVTFSLINAAARAASDPFAVTALTMLAMLMVLAICEHWFLVTPFDANVLWKWGAKTTEPVSETPIPVSMIERAERLPGPRTPRQPKITPADPAELKCV